METVIGTFTQTLDKFAGSAYLGGQNGPAASCPPAPAYGPDANNVSDMWLYTLK